MQIVCKCLGGSHSYGLNTPESDIDIRGVFVNTDYKHIISLGSHEHQKGESDDTMMYEIRKFVELLRNGNTGALEILFNTNWIDIDPLFKLRFCDNAMRLIDSHKLYKCLKGYAQHELKLAMGLRPGVIGHKRCEAVKKYGFSPKNFCQLFRLLMVGEIFFNTNDFVVDCRNFPDKRYYEFLMSVKTTPEKHTIGVLRSHFDTFERKLDEAYNTRIKTFVFDNEYISEILLKTYFPILERQYSDIINK